MKYLKYFIQYLLAIICFGLFKILGPKISSFISGKFFEKIGSNAPKELYHSEIPMLNFTIHQGELIGTIVSDHSYSFRLSSNYASARYRTFSDVSRWTTHVFKMHGTFDVGSVVDVRCSLTSYDLFQVFDYLCIRRS